MPLAVTQVVRRDMNCCITTVELKSCSQHASGQDLMSNSPDGTVGSLSPVSGRSLSPDLGGTSDSRYGWNRRVFTPSEGSEQGEVSTEESLDGNDEAAEGD